MTKWQQTFTKWKLRQMTEVSTVFDSKVGIKKKDQSSQWVNNGWRSIQSVSNYINLKWELK